MSQDAKPAQPPPDIAEIKNAAWRAALALSSNQRNAANLIYRDAQMTILRRVVSRVLSDGEAEFWRMVEEELRR